MACVGVPRRNRRLQSCLAYACRLQLSRTAAAIVSLLLAFAVLGAILAIVADSVHVLVDNADEYAKQLNHQATPYMRRHVAVSGHWVSR